MPKFFVNKSQVKNNTIEIIGEDINHIKNVLRKNVDDIIEVCNQDDGQNYLVQIKGLNKNIIKCEIKQKLESKTESNIYVHILQGLPKTDKMEMIIQKSVELGASEISPVSMKRCVAKIAPKDELKKMERWQKISEVAAKQCGRNIIPQINNIIEVKDICKFCKDYDIIIVAYENEKENKLKDELVKLKEKRKSDFKIAIVIGPEGGLEQEEVRYLKQNGAKIVTLGNRILRTETAPINILSCIMYELET